MIFVTLAPFVVIAVATAAYWFAQRHRGKLENNADRLKVKSQIYYVVMLFVYVVLPSISTYVITYFSCSRFADDGEKRGLRVITTALSIKCTTNRYRKWRIYAGIMIGIWPVGVSLIFFILLWRNGKKLNPTLEDESSTAHDAKVESSQVVDRVEDLKRETRRHTRAMGQIKKLELRDKDDSLSALEFLFEEYTPRCFLFPIFEIGRRIALTSVLAVFYPGSTRQSVVGLLGAMLSCLVYYVYEPFIEDDDNVVSAVAQGELVLIFFAALAVYTSQESDESRQAFSSVAFGIVLVLIFFASSLVAAYVILLDIFGYSSLLDARSQVLKRITRTSSGARARAGETKRPPTVAPGVELIGHTSSPPSSDSMRPNDAAMV